MSQYGEPWTTAGEIIPAITTSDGRELDLDRDRKEHFPRIIACVNALAGVRDVGKVAALLAGLRDMGTDVERYEAVLEALVAVKNELE